MKYQRRRALRSRMKWTDFVKLAETKLKKRKPPVVVYGLGGERRMGDYFMEYAQGGIGVVLNVADIANPIGYYVCSGMTAGAAYIRGEILPEQLGAGVRKLDYLTPEDRNFLKKQIEEFIAQFIDTDIDEKYNTQLKAFAESYAKDPEKIFSGFCKIIPKATAAEHNE
ncbi:MAG: hypothetical protein LRY51_01295 [Geovibrio sp.]|nr:hypothetical protein [Geovibrio sp.]